MSREQFSSVQNLGAVGGNGTIKLTVNLGISQNMPQGRIERLYHFQDTVGYTRGKQSQVGLSTFQNHSNAREPNNQHIRLWAIDLHQLRTCGKLAVDMGCDLGLEARGVKALLTFCLYIGERRSVLRMWSGAG